MLKKIERLRVRSFCSNHYMLVFFICSPHTNTLTYRGKKNKQWASNQSYNHISPQFRYIKTCLSIIVAIHSDITRKTITAGDEVADDRLSELCGLDLPSAL